MAAKEICGLSWWMTRIPPSSGWYEYHCGGGHRRRWHWGADPVLPGQQRPSGRRDAEAPVDAVVIGIVDTVDVLGKQIYSAKQCRCRPEPAKINQPQLYYCAEILRATSSESMSSVNEQLIRDVVSEVLSRLGGAPAAASAPAKTDCGCGGKGASASPALRRQVRCFHRCRRGRCGRAGILPAIAEGRRRRPRQDL